MATAEEPGMIDDGPDEIFEAYRSRVLRLELEHDPDQSDLERWAARYEDVLSDPVADVEVARSTVVTVRFVRVHGLWDGDSIIGRLDVESEMLSLVGEWLFEGLGEDAFEDLRELRGNLIVIERVVTDDLEAAAELLRTLGEVMDDSMIVLAPGFLPWMKAKGRLVSDDVGLQTAARAWKRAGFRPHPTSSNLLLLAHAEFLAAEAAASALEQE